ncbi:MAG: amino acid transporter permease [Solirubrobacterales bacterium]|nr:amino acid transporter permease [Solirubrobacterales bacterium]
MAQQFVNALVFGSVLTLFSLGLSLAWGTLDVLNLAHGALFVFAGYLAYVLTKHGSLPFALTLVVSMAGSGAVAVALELVAFQRIRTRFRVKRQAELSMLVASVGASIVVNTWVSNKTGNQVFAPSENAFHVHVWHAIGLRITNIEVIIVAVTVVVASALDLWVRRSRHGRAVRAVAYDPTTSGLLGVNVNGLAAATMFVSGALAGLAGVLLAVNISGEEVGVGQTYMLTAFAILIVGGVGSIRGAICAAYLIAIAETAVIAYGPASYRDAVAFLLILLVLLVRPQGIFSRGRFLRA